MLIVIGEHPSSLEDPCSYLNRAESSTREYGCVGQGFHESEPVGEGYLITRDEALLLSLGREAGHNELDCLVKKIEEKEKRR